MATLTVSDQLMADLVSIGYTTGSLQDRILQWYSSVGSLQSSASGFTPADQGLLAWNYDPIQEANNATIAVGGTLEMYRIRVPKGGLCTGAATIVGTAGASVVAGANFMTLFNAAMTTQLAQSVDMAVNTGGVGNLNTAGRLLTPWSGGAVQLTAGDYYLSRLVYCTGTPTYPYFCKMTSNNAAGQNFVGTPNITATYLSGGTSGQNTLALSGFTNTINPNIYYTITGTGVPANTVALINPVTGLATLTSSSATPNGTVSNLTTQAAGTYTLVANYINRIATANTGLTAMPAVSAITNQFTWANPGSPFWVGLY